MAEPAKPIIIIKKKGGHGGHHGGAWKVAYADFVTAMMALFIVLWLLNSSKKVQEAVGGYFKDPSGTAKKAGTNQAGSGQNFALTKDDMPKLKDELQKAVRKMADFEQFKNQVEMTITPEGLRIELLESEVGTFFESGSPKPSENGTKLLTMLSTELGGVPNKVMVEGHTDSKPYSGARGYGNWELSADRANSARRLMQANGLRADQVSQVRGYADQALRIAGDPMNSSNRRISVIVQNLNKPDEEKENGAAAEKPDGEKPSPEKKE
ncbi:MAG: flagellar motor protein MotB [Acidobacteria bacterium]|nr:MAG: flagellar motor protein MotB [Acidobacteriota bacterium]